MKNTKLSTVLLVFSFIFLSLASVEAAELKGEMSIKGDPIPSGASLQAKCGELNYSTTIARNGRYSLRGIKSKRSCTFTVKFPDGGTSAPISFSTRKNVVIFNAEIKRAKNTLLILRR